MDLELREFSSWNHSIQAGIMKSLYYVFGLNFIFWSSATMYNKIFHSLLEPEQLRWLYRGKDVT
jgi:hypothetical protein